MANTQEYIGLKELRLKMNQYAEATKRGKTFIVLKKIN